MNKTTIVLSLETYRLIHAPRCAKYTPQRGYDTKNRVINRAQKIANETQGIVEVVAPKSQGSRLLGTFEPIPVR